MKQFASFEEENIHYWTGRTLGYSGVNQEELASRQRIVWRNVIPQRIAARFPDREPSQIMILPPKLCPISVAFLISSACMK